MSTKMSKRIRCVVLALVLTAVSVGGMFGCGDDGGQRFYFERVYDRNERPLHYIVTGGRPDREGHLVLDIPATRRRGMFRRLPVIGVQTEAFKGNEDIRSLFIPNTVTHIPAGAFKDTVNLVSIEFEEGSQLVSIDSSRCRFVSGGQREVIVGGAFENSGLESIIFPRSLEWIGRAAFMNTQSLRKVDFEYGSIINSIGWLAFAESGLEWIRFPASLRAIGVSAFGACFNLRQVKQEENSRLEVIEYHAFAGTTSLLSFTIPYSTRIILPGIFNGWTDAQTIYIQGRNTPPHFSWVDGVLIEWVPAWTRGSEAQIIWNV